MDIKKGPLPEHLWANHS